MEHMPALDITVLIAYLAGVVGLGCWFVRRSRSTEGFMAAGRSLPGWAVGLFPVSQGSEYRMRKIRNVL